MELAATAVTRIATSSKAAAETLAPTLTSWAAIEAALLQHFERQVYPSGASIAEGKADRLDREFDMDYEDALFQINCKFSANGYYSAREMWNDPDNEYVQLVRSCDRNSKHTSDGRHQRRN